MSFLTYLYLQQNDIEHSIMTSIDKNFSHLNHHFPQTWNMEKKFLENETFRGEKQSPNSHTATVQVRQMRRTYLKVAERGAGFVNRSSWLEPFPSLR